MSIPVNFALTEFYEVRELGILGSLRLYLPQKVRYLGMHCAPVEGIMFIGGKGYGPSFLGK
jgi:hypothetical protein